MSDAIALSLSQRFEIEHMSRAIDAETDVQKLRGLTKQLLQAWYTQQAATTWVMQQHIMRP